MKRVKWIATKDHLILSGRTYYKNDELHTPDGMSEDSSFANVIMYFTSGNTRVFTSNASHNVWTTHANIQAPFGCVRPICNSVVQYTGGFGIVNLENSNAAYTVIIPKAIRNSGYWGNINTASEEEQELVNQKPTETVVFESQCFVATKRDPDTFEIYTEEEASNDIATEDLNIDWG